jgi:hypothetical protein
LDVVLFEEDFLRHLVMHPPPPTDQAAHAMGVEEILLSSCFVPLGHTITHRAPNRRAWEALTEFEANYFDFLQLTSLPGL